jgi:hypothetical protein
MTVAHHQSDGAPSMPLRRRLPGTTVLLAALATFLTFNPRASTAPTFTFDIQESGNAVVATGWGYLIIGDLTVVFASSLSS